MEETDKAVKRVMIVEDDTEIRTGFELIVNSSDRFEVLACFGSAELLLERLATVVPDILLIDIELPGMNGVEAIRKVKDAHPKIEILVVTVYDDSELVFESLKAGASGYLTKGSGYARLLEAMEELLRGGAPMSTKIARLVVNNLRLNRDNPLTKRESTILHLLAEGKTYYQMAEQLFVSRDTIKTHLKHIYSKLYVRSRAEAVAKANKQRLI